MSYLKIAILALLASVAWIVLVGYGMLHGWWHEPITDDSSPTAFLEAAQTYVNNNNVGNAALVMIEDGVIFAEHYSGKRQEINRNTVFPTASMSKWITALGVMHLLETKRIDLDSPVSTYLSRWQLPPSEFDNDSVTIRQLLSHTSGLIDGLGFGDYGPGEEMPSLEESLRHPRASSGENVQIELGRTPGSEWDYSGGGYLILQLVIEEVTGLNFSEFMETSILRPMSMSRSTYRFLGDEPNRSNSYNSDGTAATLYQYAASAATGFNASAADLAQLALGLLNNTRPGVVGRNTIELMRTPQAALYGFEIWGLGTILYAKAESGDFVYGHDGQNEPAINAAVRINPDTGDAIIVLASGNKSLATKLGFEWVYWQTGIADSLGVGYVIDNAFRVATVGLLLLWVLAALFAIHVYRHKGRISH